MDIDTHEVAPEDEIQALARRGQFYQDKPDA